MDPQGTYLYVAAQGKGLYMFDGTNWKEIGQNNGLPTEDFNGDGSCYVRSVAVDPNHSEIIYTSLWAPGLGHRKQYLFRSKDYGQTWEDISYNLGEYNSVFSLSVNPHNSDLHASTAHGNYVLSGISP